MGDFDTSRNMLNDIIAISNDSKSYELLLDIEIQTNNFIGRHLGLDEKSQNVIFLLV